MDDAAREEFITQQQRDVVAAVDRLRRCVGREDGRGGGACWGRPGWGDRTQVGIPQHLQPPRGDVVEGGDAIGQQKAQGAVRNAAADELLDTRPPASPLPPSLPPLPTHSYSHSLAVSPSPPSVLTHALQG